MSQSPDLQVNLKSKWLLVAACLVAGAILIFCCFYLFSDYSYLAAWCLKMNDCFYAHQHWQDNFFTLNTKRQGNVWCIVALLVSGGLLYHCIKRFKRPADALILWFPKKNIWLVSVCILLGTLAWIWGNSLVHQGFDEVFSAVNCASLPPFQTLSYYMLPNNHILFNVLNSTLFFFADDKVFTGKLISLICYCGTILIMFSWLAGIVKNKFLLIAITVVLAFQFPVWGFGFEARGYALYTFTAWLAFFALVQYIQSKNRQWLHYYALALIAGYWCLPTFLYFHSALLLLGLFWMVYEKVWDRRFWVIQVVAIVAVFLLYLPAICFSGVHALAGNQYVSGNINTLTQFYTGSKTAFNGYISFYTSSFTKHHSPVDLVIFLLPLTLFCFHKNRLAVLCGFFYLAMWLSCIGVAYVMKIYAIDRTISAHISISFAFTIYALYLALQKLNDAVKMPVVTDVVLIILLVMQGVSFGIGNKANASFRLYNNDINIKYDLIMHEGIATIPKGSTIAFSDECFYWYYQCMLRGDKVSRCTSGNEEYFVRLSSEALPVGYEKKYKLIKTVFKHGITAVSYEIYKKVR